MALRPCPHYQFMLAVQTILNADADIGIDDWKIQKLPSGKAKNWAPGGYISPLLSSEFGNHENTVDQIHKRTLVVLARPGELSLTSNLEDQMQKMHRIDEIFRNRGKTQVPAAITALNANQATNFWAYQKMGLEPAERFIAAAFGEGYDASGVIIRTEFLSFRGPGRLDFS